MSVSVRGVLGGGLTVGGLDGLSLAGVRVRAGVAVGVVAVGGWVTVRRRARRRSHSTP